MRGKVQIAIRKTFHLFPKGRTFEDGLGSGLISVFKNDAGRRTTAAM
jgi:hypothetical protein